MDILTYLRAADNLVTESNLTVSSGETSYPGSNLAKLPVSRVWRATEAGSRDPTMNVDIGEAASVDFAALVNHNLKRSASVQLIGADNAGLSSNAVRKDFVTSGQNAWCLLDSPQGRRYWRVAVGNAGSPAVADNMDAAQVQAGYLLLGVSKKFPMQFQPDWQRSPRKIIRKTETDIGTPLVGNVVSRGTRLEFEWLLDDGDTDTVEDILDSLDGGAMFVVPVPSRKHGYFVRLENPEAPWTTTMAVGNGPNQIRAAMVTDNVGQDL